MIGAGDLDRPIIIQRSASGAANAFGESAGVWTDYFPCRARRRDVGDKEKVEAGQVQGSLMSRFVIRSCVETRSVDTRDRLNHDGRIWQIHGVKEVSRERRHGFLEITASTSID